MKQLSGKTAFVTGGASGIGLGMVLAFLDEGMNAVVADLSDDHLAQARDRLAPQADRVHFMKLDVADRAAMARAADEAEAAFGKLHVLCNNAGVTGYLPMDQATYGDWDWLLSVNLYGVIHGIVSFLPKLRKHGEGGHIVNTGSIAGLVPAPAWGGIYSTTKFAVHGLSGSLRLSVGQYGIGVTELCPGATRTNVRDSFRLRPARFESIEHRKEPMPSLQEIGIDPLDVGRQVARAIRRNDPYVIMHAENKSHVQAFVEDMLAAFPDETVDDEGRLSYIRWFDEATARALALQPRSQD